MVYVGVLEYVRNKLLCKTIALDNNPETLLFVILFVIIYVVTINAAEAKNGTIL